MRTTALRTTVLLLLLSILAAGCGSRPQASASGGVTAELSVSPRSAAAMRPVTVRLRFTDAQGGVVPADSLEVDARMTEMSHGAERLMFRSTGRGRYEASHVFSMDGEWELQVHAVVAGKEFTTTLPLRIGGE